MHVAKNNGTILKSIHCSAPSAWPLKINYFTGWFNFSDIFSSFSGLTAFFFLLSFFVLLNGQMHIRGSISYFWRLTIGLCSINGCDSRREAGVTTSSKVNEKPWRIKSKNKKAEKYQIPEMNAVKPEKTENIKEKSNRPVK